MANPLSIGDSRQKLKAVREEYPLPKERKSVIATIESLLGKGGVQRLVVELGKPILITRMVRPEEAPDVEELPESDLLAASRNAAMEEFVTSSNLNPYEYLFKAFYKLTQRHLTAKAFVVNRLSTLKEWLQVDDFFELPELFGVEVVQDTSMPHDGLLLVATNAVEDTPWLEVALSLRLVMNLPKGKGSNETNH